MGLVLFLVRHWTQAGCCRAFFVNPLPVGEGSHFAEKRQMLSKVLFDAGSVEGGKVVFQNRTEVVVDDGSNNSAPSFGSLSAVQQVSPALWAQGRHFNGAQCKWSLVSCYLCCLTSRLSLLSCRCSS